MSDLPCPLCGYPATELSETAERVALALALLAAVERRETDHDTRIDYHEAQQRWRVHTAHGLTRRPTLIEALLEAP